MSHNQGLASVGLPPEESSLRLWIKLLKDQIEQTRKGTIAALAVLFDLKQLETGLPASELAQWAVAVAENLGVEGEALRTLEIASTLHDLGKVGIPDSILRNPGPLSAEESELMRKHPEYGWCILRLILGFEQASLVVLHHQEWYDGSGYPAGLEGDEIPLGSRIIAVIDAFDSIVSDRPYRRARAPEEAFRRLRAGKGTQFDPLVVERFIEVASEGPTCLEDAVGPSEAAYERRNPSWGISKGPFGHPE